MIIRIGVYGGTNLSDDQVKLVESITIALTKLPDIIIVSGGFHFYINHPHNSSVDKVVMETVKKNVSEDEFPSRFETWLPKENDRKDVVRFREGTTKEIAGSSQARRFHVVTQVDAIITIAGEGNTRSVIELALAINKPVLPISFTGGDSKKMWLDYQDDIINRIKLPTSLRTRLSDESLSIAEISKLGSEIAEFMQNACKRTCLVLMPFAIKDNQFYDTCIRPAITEGGYYDFRIDRNVTAGNIPDLFQNSLEETAAVIVDITRLNPNVMYELGYVHSKKIKPLIVMRHESIDTWLPELPFYLKQEMVIKESDDEHGYAKIKDYIVRYLESNRAQLPSPFIYPQNYLP